MASGPTPLALGNFAFQTFGFSFADLSDKLETPWADIETAGGFDTPQWTGPKKETLSIKGSVFPEEFGGMGTLAGLKDAGSNGQIMPLVTGSGSILGLFFITGIENEQGKFLANGRPLKVSYTINLQQFRGQLSPASVMSQLLNFL